MSQSINGSIELTKLTAAVTTTDKGTRCIMIPLNQEGIQEKEGRVWLNFNVNINDEVNKFGQDTSFSISQTKEQREAKQPRKYIGNGKTFWRSDFEQKPKEALPSVKSDNYDEAVGNKEPEPIEDKDKIDLLPF